jgi:hypothetical protein
VIERLRRAEELIKHQYLFVYRVIVNVPFSRDKLDGEPVFAIPNSS